MATLKKHPPRPRKGGKRGPYDPDGMRAKILDESIHLFAQEGFFQTSFQSIAKRLLVSQSALLNHYPSKISLIEAVIREVVARGQAFTSTDDDPAIGADERLVRHFKQTAEWAIKRPSEAQVLLLLYYMGAWSEDFRKIYEQILAKARHRILTIILSGTREGVFHLAEDPETVAQVLHDCLLGSILNEISTSRLKSVPKRLEEKREALFRGLLRKTLRR